MARVTEVRQLEVALIRPNPWNPNTVEPAVMAALIANVQRVGFVQPILVREIIGANGRTEAYEVVDGEHRYRAAIEAGLEKVPAVVTRMTEGEARAQTIALNKIRGEMEAADVAAVLRESGYDQAELASFTGYGLDELGALDALLEFNWNPEPGSSPPPLPDDGETWVTVSVRCPESVALLARAELDRLKYLLDTEHDHLALEVMVQASAQVPNREVVG